MKTIRHLMILFAMILSPAFSRAQGTKEDYDRSARLRELTQGKVFKAAVDPHWFANNDRFWYRNDLPDKAREFILVDAVAGKREDAFDHEKLAAALAKQSGREVKATHLPFERIDFDGDAVHFRAFDKAWSFDRKTSALTLG